MVCICVIWFTLCWSQSWTIMMAADDQHQTHQQTPWYRVVSLYIWSAPTWYCKMLVCIQWKLPRCIQMVLRKSPMCALSGLYCIWNCFTLLQIIGQRRWWIHDCLCWWFGAIVVMICYSRLIFFSSGVEEEPPLGATPSHIRSMAERDARAMEAATRAMEEATKRMEEARRVPATPEPLTMGNGNRDPMREQRERERERESSSASTTPTSKSEEPPLKRLITEEERLMAHIGMPSAHIKVTSRSKYAVISVYEWKNVVCLGWDVNICPITCLSVWECVRN